MTAEHMFCTRCNFPLTELGSPAPDEIVTCPRCGASDRYAALAKPEAQVSRPSMVDQFRGIMRGRK